MKWLKRIGIGVLVVLVVAFGSGVWLVRRSFPTIDGSVTVRGLSGPVTVTRDTDGIPHIQAATTHDLFMAQGYVHAQDRFWQMDFWRHIGSGRLSELFGDSQVDTDIFLRTLGFAGTAATEYADSDPDTKLALDAYAQGVNAYLSTHTGSRLALEYAVLGLQNSGYTPEPWTPVDTLTWAKVMAWDLRSNLDEEIDRAVLSQTIPVDRVEQLYPPMPADHPVIVPGFTSGAERVAATPLSPTVTAALERVRSAADALDGVTGGGFEGIGSNNWVVSGSRTASGSPLLANDPHLANQMPSIWYENHLRCQPIGPDCPYDVEGFSFAGAPGVVVGHNQRIAWGVTNEGPDSMDLFIERLDPNDPDSYEVNGSFRPMETRTETIDVAGGDPVQVVIRSTRHGPVVSDSYGSLDDLRAGGAVDLPTDYAVAMSWTALDPAYDFASFLAIDRATGWDEFHTALSTFDIAAQNFVYADVDGNIGYQSTGRIPVRASGDGRYPVPGWNDDHEWVGYIPYDRLPNVVNPSSGYIVTANQPVIAPDPSLVIGFDQSTGYRAARIDALLSPLRAATVADMQHIQMDGQDGSAESLVPALLAVASDDPAVTSIQDLLRGWGSSTRPYQQDAGSAGAAAYDAVWRQVLARTFDDELPTDRRAGGNERYFEVVRLLLDRPDDPWWDDVSTPTVEHRDDILTASMAAAHAELADLLGADPSHWEWGTLHTAHFENQTFGQSGIGPIEALFNRTSDPVVGGTRGAVNAVGWTPYDGYQVDWVPSMRMVVDLSDLSGSFTINTTGQSGHPFARHYFDQNLRWAKGEYHPMRWADDQIAADTEGVLQMLP